MLTHARLPLIALFIAAAALGSGSLAHGQTLIHYRTALNNASRFPAGLPGGAIARGAIFTLNGKNIGPTTGSPPQTDPPSTTLGGVSLAITLGTTTVNAIPLTVSATQIQAIMPANAPVGLASMRLTYNNARSNPMPVQIVASQFGIYTMNGLGSGPAHAQVVNDDGTTVPVNNQTPVMPGQNVAITGTGLGGVALNNITVNVGGAPATVLQTAPVTGSPGQDQIIFTVPAAAPFGCWVPVYVKTSTGATPATAVTAVSNFATLAISVDGTPCTEPNNALAQALVNGGNIGLYLLYRFAVRHDIMVPATADTIADYFSVYHGNEVADPNAFHPEFSLPPAGSCLTYPSTGDYYGFNSPLTGSTHDAIAAIIPGLRPPSGGALDAGDASVVGAKGTVTSSSKDDPTAAGRTTRLGGAVLSTQVTNTAYLNSGNVTFNVKGGKDVGASSTDTPVPTPFNWTNRDQIKGIDRSQDLTLTFTGGDPNASTVLVGSNLDLPTNSALHLVCVAAPGSTSLVIPSDVLANIPASRPYAEQSMGILYLGQLNLVSPAQVTTTGLDFASLIPAYIAGKGVSFR